jgi:hypothetical protein
MINIWPIESKLPKQFRNSHLPPLLEAKIEWFPIANWDFRWESYFFIEGWADRLFFDEKRSFLIDTHAYGMEN